jgi:hypothetical protein
MKCVGEANQPCARCLKTGRKCVFQPNSDHKKVPAYGEHGLAFPHDASKAYASAPNSNVNSPRMSPNPTQWAAYSQFYQPSFGNAVFTHHRDQRQAFSPVTTPEAGLAYVNPPLVSQSPLALQSPLATLPTRPNGLAARSRSHHDTENAVPPMTPVTPGSPNVSRRRSVSEMTREKPSEDEMSQLCRL